MHDLNLFEHKFYSEYNILKQTIDTILLDFDGTIFDTAPDLVGALNTILQERSLPPVDLEEFRFMAGAGALYLVQNAFKLYNQNICLKEITNELISNYYARLTLLTKPFPNAIETIKKLKDDGYTLGICTNKPSLATNKILDHFELRRLFNVVVCGDQVENKKPHADHLLYTLQLMNKAIRKAVMVGDTEADVLSAHNAGIPVIITDYGYSPIPCGQLGADLVISDFSELPKSLRMIETKF